MQKYTKELELLVKDSKKSIQGHKTKVASYVMVYKDLTWDWVENTACHAYMSGWEWNFMHHPRGKEMWKEADMVTEGDYWHVSYILNGMQTRAGGVTEEIEREYMDWLINDSVFASAFITKDINRALEDRIVILNTDCEKNYTAAAIVSCRGVSEHGQIAISWHHMRNNGVEDHVAWMLAHSFHKKIQDVYVYDYKYEHCSFRGNYALSNHVKFLKAIEDFDRYNEPYGDANTYSYISAWFDPDSDYERSFVDDINELMVKINEEGDEAINYTRLFTGRNLSFNEYFINNNQEYCDKLDKEFNLDYAVKISEHLWDLATGEDIVKQKA